MNVLIVGSGAREHALAWKLRQSPLLGDLYVAPGNGGTAQLARNLKIAPTDVPALVAAAREYRVDLVVPGMEVALAAGLVDACLEAGIQAFGPTQAAASIESSKAFAKELMAESGVPTAPCAVFEDFAAAEAYIREAGRPLVVKVDGLAAGKGVTVACDAEEAITAAHAALVDGVFGEAGARIVIEERLSGREVSYHLFVDGETYVPMVPVCDYKRVDNGDQGPNTGGMGSYSPPAFFTDELAARIHREIVEPTLRALARRGTPYRGVLYLGLMIDDGAARVVEYNCRFGDPESQVIVRRLDSDLLAIMRAVSTSALTPDLVRWNNQPAVAVVLASGGYPGEFETGLPITGLDRLSPEVTAFHAGTRQRPSLSFPPVLETSGGRVLTLVGTGDDLAQARDAVYADLPLVHFLGRHYRTDIALQELEALGLRPRVLVAPPPPRRSARVERDLAAANGAAPEGGMEGRIPGAAKRRRKRRGKRKRGSGDGASGAQTATSPEERNDA